MRRRKRGTAAAAEASGHKPLASLLLTLLLLASTASLPRVVAASTGDASAPAATTTTKATMATSDGIVAVKSSPSSPSPSPSHSPSASASQQRSSSDTAAARAGAAHNTAATDALFFFALMLLIGIFTVHVLEFTKIPYTALLLIWGIVLGVSLETFASKWPLLPAGARLWEAIDPNLLLAGFLPILLFAGAFALEWHVVRRLLPSSLLLAGPGVIVGAGITAALVKVSFPHDWSWGKCLLFGAMFSATDPVAVVAVLREAGLSKRLRTLVDLEALLNDGTAYVLFFVMRRFVVEASNFSAAAVASAGSASEGLREEERLTVAGGFATFFRLAAGGVVLGLAFGVATTAWLRYMYNAPMPEITITFVSAFLAYLVGDRLLGVSGVVSFFLFVFCFIVYCLFFSRIFFSSSAAAEK